MRLITSLALKTANQREIVDRFRSARAVTGATALPLRELRLNDSVPLRVMVAASLIRRAGPERYFLDEKAWASMRGLKGGTVLRLALGLLLAAAVVALATM